MTWPKVGIFAIIPQFKVGFFQRSPKSKVEFLCNGIFILGVMSGIKKMDLIQNCAYVP
jgi:hypothetical protein